jgi:transposase
MRELSVAEQRYQAVLAVISDGLSISQVAEKVGVSRQTLHSWLARYELPEQLPRASRAVHR